MELIRLSGNKEERELFEKRRQSLLEEVSAYLMQKKREFKREQNNVI